MLTVPVLPFHPAVRICFFARRFRPAREERNLASYDRKNASAKHAHLPSGRKDAILRKCILYLVGRFHPVYEYSKPPCQEKLSVYAGMRILSDRRTLLYGTLRPAFLSDSLHSVRPGAAAFTSTVKIRIATNLKKDRTGNFFGCISRESAQRATTQNFTARELQSFRSRTPS